MQPGYERNLLQSCLSTLRLSTSPENAEVFDLNCLNVWWLSGIAVTLFLGDFEAVEVLFEVECDLS